MCHITNADHRKQRGRTAPNRALNKNKKQDMSKKCGFKYEILAGQVYRNKIPSKNLKEYYCAYCKKCKYMYVTCMYGEE